MSELTDSLDELVDVMLATMTTKQIAKMAVGYFAAVEAWKQNPGFPDGLLWYHGKVTNDFKGEGRSEN